MREHREDEARVPVTSQETCRYQVHPTPSREGEDVSVRPACAAARAASFFCVKGEAFSLPSPSRYSTLLFFCVMVLLTAAVSPSQAQTDSVSQRDTLHSYVLQEIIVTSQRIPRSALTAPALIQVISRRAIDLTGGSSLATVLGPASGLFIKDYGGPSGLKTISQRGLGAEHTLILLNGMPINSAHTGGFDLGLLSSDDIGAVEMVGGRRGAGGDHRDLLQGR